MRPVKARDHAEELGLALQSDERKRHRHRQKEVPAVDPEWSGGRGRGEDGGGFSNPGAQRLLSESLPRQVGRRERDKRHGPQPSGRRMLHRHAQRQERRGMPEPLKVLEDLRWKKPLPDRIHQRRNRYAGGLPVVTLDPARDYQPQAPKV